MVEAEGEFIPPPEAPVFEPSWEEFQDALAFIAKIRPIAEKTGICKIKPPPEWQPPFAVDVDTFRFTPRVQRLNELEAKSRIKLNFLDQLAKFWELQGSPLKIPSVERKYLDLYLLQKIVNEEGGFDGVCKERKWTKVASRLGYPGGKGVGSVLRTHYERLLYPFDLFRAGATVGGEVRFMPRMEELKPCDRIKTEPLFQLEQVERKKEQETVRIKEEFLSGATQGGSGTSSNASTPQTTPKGTPVKSEGQQGGKNFRRSRRIAKDDTASVSLTANPELRKLQFYGPGPKAAIAEIKDEPEGDGKVMKTRDKKNVSYVDTYLCNVCNRGDGEEAMLLCDGCDDAFHTYCLLPPLTDIPRGDWRCPKCVAKECGKPHEAFGFEQAKTQYSLQTFGEMADQFKLDYFNRPVHMVPCSTVEREFWRLVNCLEEDVVVEYGADIHALEMGSGFPTIQTKELFPEDEDYLESSWNLNNLPVLESSVLKHIHADISGMKVPWCYVGMCFSSFAWHIEDHWSYSVNYMHWGEPKTWYGVPGPKAELLEECMKKNAPELFEQSPDLLHQLTTIMNPNTLMAYGVPIVRTDQHAGEFVITFPRSYHAGFNQGYNFAEAVNFCPADWIPLGRACIAHYRLLHRQCVFSHEELVCKMAADPENLDLSVAAAVHQDMLDTVEEERKLRKLILERGTVDAEREAFELLPDDERQCGVCKTTCFLSAVTCPCSPNVLVCPYHADDLCKCAPSSQCLRYRYTLDELPAMLQRLKVRAESFDNWSYKVKTALEAHEDQKLDLADMRELLTEAAEKKYPDSPLLQALMSAVGEAEKCATVASQLVSAKVRTRNRQAGDSKYAAKLSMDELKCFSDQVQGLPCKIREATLVVELLDSVKSFQGEAQEALSEETPDSEKLQRLLDQGITLDVDLPEVPSLKQVLQQARWLDDVRQTLAEDDQVTLEAMRKLIESGVGLAPHPACEKAMAELQELLTVSERWEEKARLCLQAKPRHVVATLESIISETKDIPTYLPNVAALNDSVRKAKEWTAKVDTIQNAENYPYQETLEVLVNKGRPIPARLDQLPQIESQLSAAKSWKERTARTFLKKNSSFNLVEVLSPRTDMSQYQSGRNRRRKREADRDREGLSNTDGKVDETRDPAAIVAGFKADEIKELEVIIELRALNMAKNREETSEHKFCMCRKGPAGLMLQCELCKDWFHGTCVPLPKSANLKSKTSQAALVQAARDLKFLCPLCLRSRRPRLETILSLLVSLQKLPVRLPEGESLQCLTERAMAWQDKARQALATDELSTALNKLSVLSRKAVEQAAREKTEKIISTELLKAASNPDLHTHLQNVSQNAFTGAPETGIPGEMDGNDENLQQNEESLSPPPPPTCDTPPLSEDAESDSQHQVPAPLGMSSEHAYSSVSKTNGAAPKKQQRKSSLVPRQIEASILQLSTKAREQLERLMMEGDLLEVSLDETQHIWRILQACLPASCDKILCFGDIDRELLRERGDKSEEKKKKKKRKKEEGAPPDGEGVPGEKKEGEKPKKKKIKIGKDGKPKEGGEKTPDEKKKKRRRKPDGEPGSKVQRKRKDVVVVDDDEEDDCSAVKCLKPTGDEVNWVQCDKCELWFHLLCIGLGEDEVSENEDYICFQCKNGGKPRDPLPGAELGAILSQKAMAELQTVGMSRPVAKPAPAQEPEDVIIVDYAPVAATESDVIDVSQSQLPLVQNGTSPGTVEAMEVENAIVIEETPPEVTTIQDGALPNLDPETKPTPLSSAPVPTVSVVSVSESQPVVTSVTATEVSSSVTSEVTSDATPLTTATVPVTTATVSQPEVAKEAQGMDTVVDLSDDTSDEEDNEDDEKEEPETETETSAAAAPRQEEPVAMETVSGTAEENLAVTPNTDSSQTLL